MEYKLSGTYNCGQNVKLSLYKDCLEKHYTKASEEITKSGYQLYEANNKDYIHSKTFIKDKNEIVLIFSEKDNTLRIIEDGYTKLINKKPLNPGPAPIKLWQFEVDHSLIDCGMCYIIQNSDYSFFIIDSAHFYSVNDDLRIFNFLKKHTPDEKKIRVSGWFFSHGHVDHIAKFCDILKYNNDIEIDGLYYNFVPLDHPSSFNWMQSDKNHTKDFLELTESCNIPIYKLHTGQYFFINDIRFDVLCTHEDVYPNSLENFNDSSCVIMMTVGEDKVCFPGDAGHEESKILERNYPNFLKCDIMQCAHHAHFGCTKNFYELAKADVILFPTTKIKFDEDWTRFEANRKSCQIAEYSFIASDGTVEFTFPLKDSMITLYPDETFENFDGVYNLWGYQYTDEYKKELKKRYLSNQCIRQLQYKKSNKAKLG